MSLICLKKGCVSTNSQGETERLTKTKACGHKLTYRFKIDNEEFKESTKTANYAAALQRHNVAYAKAWKEMAERKDNPELVAKREAEAAKEPIPTLREYIAPPEGDFPGGPWWTVYATAQYKDVETTFNNYRDRAKQLLKYKPLADCHLDQIDLELIMRYRSHRVNVTRVKNGTANYDVTVLGLILRTAQRMGVIQWLPNLPTAKEQLPVKAIGHDISKEEEDLYLQAVTERGYRYLRLLALLGLDAGLEPGGVVVRKLDWTMIHLDQTEEFNYGWIHNPHTKTDTRERDLGIVNPRLRDALVEQWTFLGCPKSGPVFRHPEHLKRAINYSTLDQQHRRLWKGPRALPFRRFRPYDLRHSLATRAGESGLDVRKLQGVMGWKNPKMAERYVHKSRRLRSEATKEIRRGLIEMGFMPPDQANISNDEILRRLCESKVMQRWLAETYPSLLNGGSQD